MTTRRCSARYPLLMLRQPSVLPTVVLLLLASAHRTYNVTSHDVHVRTTPTAEGTTHRASTHMHDDWDEHGPRPRRVHLTVGTDPSSSMTVSFASSPSSSSSKYGGEGRRTAAVFVGRHPSSLNQTFLERDPGGRRYNYTSSLTMHTYTSDYLHHVTVRGLQADTKYFYQCAILLAGEEAGASRRRRGMKREVNGGREWRWRSGGSPERVILRGNVSTFVTAPRPGYFGGENQIQLAFVGDVGTSRYAERVIRHMTDEAGGGSGSGGGGDRISSILLVGDVSYARGDQTVWDDWSDLMEPLTSRVPLQIAPGNNEIEVDAVTDEIFAPLDHRFVMPSSIAGYKRPAPGATVHSRGTARHLVYEHGNAYYAYTYGPARFVVLCSFSDLRRGSVQYSWLEGELGAVDRTVTPWLFVAFHVPVYNPFGGGGMPPRTRGDVEPLFVLHGVNMVLSGHIHSYMRSKTVAYGRVDPRGPRYVIIGDGGRGGSTLASPLPSSPLESPPSSDDSFGAPSSSSAELDLDLDPPPEWVEKMDKKTHGYATLKLVNATHAFWRWRRNEEEKRSTVHDDGAYLENQFLVS